MINHTIDKYTMDQNARAIKVATHLCIPGSQDVIKAKALTMELMKEIGGEHFEDLIWIHIENVFIDKSHQICYSQDAMSEFRKTIADFVYPVIKRKMRALMKPELCNWEDETDEAENDPDYFEPYFEGVKDEGRKRARDSDDNSLVH